MYTKKHQYSHSIPNVFYMLVSGLFEPPSTFMFSYENITQGNRDGYLHSSADPD